MLVCHMSVVFLESQQAIHFLKIGFNNLQSESKLCYIRPYLAAKYQFTNKTAMVRWPEN